MSDVCIAVHPKGGQTAYSLDTIGQEFKKNIKFQVKSKCSLLLKILRRTASKMKEEQKLAPQTMNCL